MLGWASLQSKARVRLLAEIDPGYGRFFTWTENTFGSWSEVKTEQQYLKRIREIQHAINQPSGRQEQGKSLFEKIFGFDTDTEPDPFQKLPATLFETQRKRTILGLKPPKLSNPALVMEKRLKDLKKLDADQALTLGMDIRQLSELKKEQKTRGISADELQRELKLLNEKMNELKLSRPVKERVNMTLTYSFKRLIQPIMDDLKQGTPIGRISTQRFKNAGFSSKDDFFKTLPLKYRQELLTTVKRDFVRRQLEKKFDLKTKDVIKGRVKPPRAKATSEFDKMKEDFERSPGYKIVPKKKVGDEFQSYTD